jgi:chromosome segregation ATPase
VELVEGASQAQEKLLGLSRNIGALATAINQLRDSFGEWSKGHSQQVKDIGEMVGQLRDAVEPLLREWKTVSDQIAQNANASREGLRSANDQLANTCRQLDEILRTQQGAFGAVAGQVADSLREGHQRFLAEVSDRFDQGEGLYQRLESVQKELSEHRSGLTQHAKALQEFATQAQTLPGVLETYRDSIAAMQATAKDLERVVTQLAAILVDRETKYQQRFQEVLGRAFQELRQPLSQLDGLPGAVRDLGQATKELTASLRSVSNLGQAAKDLREVAETLRRRRSSMFWDVGNSPVVRWLQSLRR